MTRIRYSRFNGQLKSQWLLAGHRMVQVRINLVYMVASVWDDSGKILGKKWKGKNKRLLQIEAKKRVRNLGVLIFDEIRPGNKLIK